MDRQRDRIHSIQSIDSDQLDEIENGAAGNTRKEEDVPLSDPMSWYPAVAPPTGGKRDIFDSDKVQSVDARAKDAPRELYKSYRELGTYLTSGLTSNLEKVRAIFVWMGVQNVVNSLDMYSSYPSADSPEFLMKKAAEGENSAFVTLFTLLCRKAHVPCMTVKGKVKAAAYDPGHRETCGSSQWVIVYVASGWRFVHPLWAFKFVQNYNRGVWTLVEDCGKATRKKSIKDEGKIQGHVDEFWFLTDPEDFNFLCHPEDSDKQLLACPWTEETYLDLPGLKADFFKSPWKLLGPHKAVIDTNKGKCSISFQHPMEGKAKVKYRLFFDEEKSQGKLPSALQMDLYVTRLKAKSGVVSLLTRLPVVGLYKLEVSGVRDKAVSVLGHFCLHCSEVSEAPKPFPSNPENGFGYDETSRDAGIANPSQTEGVMLVNRGQLIDFSFQVDEEKELKPQLKHGLKRPEDLISHITVTRDRDQVKIGVELPPEDTQPEYALEIYVGGRGKSVSEAEGRRMSIKDDKDRSVADESEINNDYKRSTSTLDPVSQTQTNSRSDNSENSNSSEGGNTLVDPVSALPLVTASPGTGGDVRGTLINALNYLLTSDKEVHDESSNEMKELHRQLQEALAMDDEKTIREALRRFIDAGLEDPVAMAKVKAREHFWWQKRETLHSAVETKSMNRINRAIEDFTSHNMEDTGELQPAVDRLMALSQRAVKSAVTSRSLPQLGSVLKRVRTSHVSQRARATPWFREAQCFHTNEVVRELCEGCTEKVKTASVLSLADRPLNRQLLALLRATLSLLGEDDDSIKSGQSVKSRLREMSAGKSRLLERIKNFQVERISKRHVNKAHRELSFCDVDDLEKDNGSTARQLYDWCRSMVKELEYHVWDDDMD